MAVIVMEVEQVLYAIHQMEIPWMVCVIWEGIYMSGFKMSTIQIITEHPTMEVLGAVLQIVQPIRVVLSAERTTRIGCTICNTAPSTSIVGCSVII